MMLIPIEYRIRCDNGAKCRGAYTLHRVKHAAGRVVADPFLSPGVAVLLANTKTAARRKATAAGWVRVKQGPYGPMVDLCPECAAGREVSS